MFVECCPADLPEKFLCQKLAVAKNRSILCKNQNNPLHPAHLDSASVGLVGSAINKHPALCSRDLHLPNAFMVKLIVGEVYGVCAGAAIPHVMVC